MGWKDLYYCYYYISYMWDKLVKIFNSRIEYQFMENYNNKKYVNIFPHSMTRFLRFRMTYVWQLKDEFRWKNNGE